MFPDDLIKTARGLVNLDQNSHGQANLKRALSTAYYAMFHALCRNCADSFVGTEEDNRSQRAWEHAYRVLDHKPTKNRCNDQEFKRSFPEGVQDFARKFIELQEKRHDADYNPSYTLTSNDVLNDIGIAEIAIKKLNSAAIKDKRAFAVWTAFGKR
ncbi:MAG: hypothetical protein OXH90_07575 [Paracoccaceae bacterium]|nr:hypothetical protein [Paracoccaceae bacterium]MDE2916410.1 hypothetical protein [Paracoccaceae bacterium]